MKTVALTGSIASGKTFVLKFVRSLRLPAIDCDALAQKLYRLPAVKKKLLAEFNTAERKEIAKIAFSSSKKRKSLESILHPLVWKLVTQKLSKFQKQKKPVAFVDVPLLFEAGWQNRFDKTVFVRATRAQCLARLKKRGLSQKEAVQRWNAQLSPRKKVKRAHYTIDNTGTRMATKRQVRKLVDSLMH